MTTRLIALDTINADKKLIQYQSMAGVKRIKMDMANMTKIATPAFNLLDRKVICE